MFFRKLFCVKRTEPKFQLKKLTRWRLYLELQRLPFSTFMHRYFFLVRYAQILVQHIHKKLKMTQVINILENYKCQLLHANIDKEKKNTYKYRYIHIYPDWTWSNYDLDNHEFRYACVDGLILCDQ